MLRYRTQSYALESKNKLAIRRGDVSCILRDRGENGQVKILLSVRFSRPYFGHETGMGEVDIVNSESDVPSGRNSRLEGHQV